ncbi:MAG: hypothetical protein J5879_08345 [Clostridia bacterium]|nr:hypothetical protein [Clostridia bacterium]
MKKITAVLLVLTIALSAFVITANAETEKPKLVYEPATVTARPGSRVVLETVAQGKDLHFSWLVQTSEAGVDKTFDFSKQAGINGFESLDGKGKMKVSFKTEKLDGDQVKHDLIIDNIIDTNYGISATCTVANDAGYVNCDTAVIYASDNAPPVPDIKMIAEYDLRRHKIGKLACNVNVPDGAGYTWDDIEFNWYKTPDGSRDSGYSLDEHDPVLISGAYATTPGTHYFYCSMYIMLGITDFYMESAVTQVNVYEPVNDIKFNCESITLDEGEEFEISVSATVTPEKDKGELSYEWFEGEYVNNICISVPDSNSTTLKIKGKDYASTEYYTCVVTNSIDDGFSFDNAADDKPYVKVVHTGEKAVKINKMPEDVTANEGENVTFSVQAENAAKYLWYAENPEGNVTYQLKSGEHGVISGENSDTVTLKATSELNGYKFYCKLKSKGGNIVNTDAAKLTVNKVNAAAPTVELEPLNMTVMIGSDVKLTATASTTDGGTLSYQWYECPDNDIASAKPIDGATESIYVPEQTVGVRYYCVGVTNELYGDSNGPVYSKIAAIEFLSGTSTDTQNVTGDVTTNGGPDSPEGSGKAGKIAILALVALISILCLALVIVGIVVLIKAPKRKK